MKDDTFFRGIRGPVGSGKSVGCCVEVFRRAIQQKKAQTEYAKAAGLLFVIPIPNLELLLSRLGLDWFPEKDWGKFTWSVPYTHRIQKGDIDLEVLFLALDRPEDVKKLLSLELTGIWINEAREVAKSRLLMPVRCVLVVILLCVMAVLLGLALLPIPTPLRKIIGGPLCLEKYQSQIIYRVSKLRCWLNQTTGLSIPSLLVWLRGRIKMEK